MVELGAKIAATALLFFVIGGACVSAYRTIRDNIRLFGLANAGRRAAMGAAPDILTIVINLIWVLLLALGGFWG
jgi:hypothetical protein